MAKEVEIIVKATDQASKTFDAIGNKSSTFADKIKANLNTIRVASGAVTTAFVAMGKKFIDDANNSIEQSTKLTTVLKQRTNATDEQIKKIQEMASAQQRLGIIEDDMQVAGLQQLGTFVTQTETLEKLGPAMNNLIAQQKGFNATQGDAINIGNLMGKVLQGQVGALTKVGISFTEAQEKVLKFGSESERASMLAQVITDNVGEMNSALADTFQGRMVQLNNTLGDVGETIGTAMIPVIQSLLEKVVPIVNKIADWIAKNPELATTIFAVVGGLAGLTFAVSMLAPAIAPVLTALAGPMGFIALLALAFAGLNMLEGLVVSTSEKMAGYRNEIAQLDMQYQMGAITQEEYQSRLAEITGRMEQAQAQAMTFGQTLKDNLDQILTNMAHPIQSTIQAFKDFGIIVNAVGTMFDNFVLKIVEGVRQVVAWTAKLRRALDVGSEENIVARGLNSLTGRATGGPVAGNTPYIVGEKGPELFVPNTSGNIVPNDKLGSGGQTININMGGVVVQDQADENRLVEKISESLKRQNQLYLFGIN